jgi:hypothetical protein
LGKRDRSGRPGIGHASGLSRQQNQSAWEPDKNTINRQNGRSERFERFFYLLKKCSFLSIFFEKNKNNSKTDQDFYFSKHQRSCFSFLLKRNSSSSTCWTMFCNFLHIIRHKNGVWHKRNSLISSFSFYVPEISKWKVEIILIYFSYGLFMVECWFDFKVEK